MTFELSPAGLALSDEYQQLLRSYRPQCVPDELWGRTRADVLDLVAKCEPKFPREVAALAGSLCRLLATFADQIDEPTVAALLTQRNVDALIARFALDGMNKGTLGQQQVRLRRLLRTQAGTPKSAPQPKRKARELQPYSEAEVQQLVDCLDRGPGSVRQAGLDALLLGLGHGIVLPHTDEVTSPDWSRPDLVPGWSADFDTWVADALARGDVDELEHFRTRAPGLRYAHPTVEHFTPLFVTLGASTDATAPVTTVIDGFAAGLAKRSVQAA